MCIYPLFYNSGNISYAFDTVSPNAVFLGMFSSLLQFSGLNYKDFSSKVPQSSRANQLFSIFVSISLYVREPISLDL